MFTYIICTSLLCATGSHVHIKPQNFSERLGSPYVTKIRSEKRISFNCCRQAWLHSLAPLQTFCSRPVCSKCKVQQTLQSRFMHSYCPCSSRSHQSHTDIIKEAEAEQTRRNCDTTSSTLTHIPSAEKHREVFNKPAIFLYILNPATRRGRTLSTPRTKQTQAEQFVNLNATMSQTHSRVRLCGPSALEIQKYPHCGQRRRLYLTRTAL